MVNAAVPMSRSCGPRAELDRDTLERARQGETAGCKGFVEFYQRLVFAALGRIMGPRHRAVVPDLAQETFVRALRALPRFDPDGAAKVSTWLLKIATRRALTELRRRPIDAPAPELLILASERGDPERVHQRHALEHAIATLTPEQRAVFVLRDYHGFTDVETASALGIDVAAIKSRLYRARTRLRKALAEDREHDS